MHTQLEYRHGAAHLKRVFLWRKGSHLCEAGHTGTSEDPGCSQSREGWEFPMTAESERRLKLETTEDEGKSQRAQVSAGRGRACHTWQGFNKGTGVPARAGKSTWGPVKRKWDMGDRRGPTQSRED